MTVRLADVSVRIDGITQLAAVVNAMKGIAAARAHTARAQLAAADSFAATITAAISSVLMPGESSEIRKPVSRKVGLLLFCAEQGFAGAFSERVFDALSVEDETATWLVIGSRGLAVATSHGKKPDWSAAMPSHSLGLPKLADAISKSVWAMIEAGRIDTLEAVYTGWIHGQAAVLRKTLFPIDLSEGPSVAAHRPLTQLPSQVLLNALLADHLFAAICQTALHAFSAENEARLQAMTAAGGKIARELIEFEAILRRVRQEQITAEIIELGTGALSLRAVR